MRINRLIPAAAIVAVGVSLAACGTTQTVTKTVHVPGPVVTQTVKVPVPGPTKTVTHTVAPKPKPVVKHTVAPSSAPSTQAVSGESGEGPANAGTGYLGNKFGGSLTNPCNFETGYADGVCNPTGQTESEYANNPGGVAPGTATNSQGCYYVRMGEGYCPSTGQDIPMQDPNQ